MLSRKLLALKRVVPLKANELDKQFKFVVEPFQLHRLEPAQGPDLQVEISKGELLDMYASMVLMRRMETAADALYKQKLIRGFCHLNSGQEAVSVGIESAIADDDSIITAYRCHGFTMVRGGTVTSILAELLGRQAGITKGKGGSMHMFAPEFYGGNGIVGAQVPLGAGVAFKHWYKGTKKFCISLYGDGAANQGQIFEAYNLAKLWNLPAAFICENNRYGMGTSASRASASFEYYTRGDYIAGVKANGMDVLAIHTAMKFARNYCVNEGPLVLELETYRYGGHSMSDPGTTYRTREEITNMRSRRDPIVGLKTRLLSESIASEEELKAIDKACKEHVDKSVDEAKSSPEPSLDELHRDIYVEKVTMRGVMPPAME